MKRAMFKKVLSYCILLLCLCIALPSAVASATEPESPYTFTYDEETYVLEIMGSGELQAELLPEEIFEYIWYCNELRISEGFTSIGEGAFTNWYMKKVVLPDTLISVGDGAFAHCHPLQTVTFPKNLQSIGTAAFNCTGLKEVILPEQVVSIGDYAFTSCYNLSYISIPDSLQYLGKAAFIHSADHVSFQISEDHPYFTVDEQGILYDKEMTTLKNCFKKDITDLTVPATVRVIEEQSCCELMELKTLNLPEGLEEIHSYAFYNCEKLEKLALPHSVTHIEEYAFTGSGMVELSIPKRVQLIGDYAFNNLSNLKTLRFTGADMTCEPMGVIGERAFSSCDSLTEIELPYGIRSIGEHAFEGCYGLRSVKMADGVTELGEGIFELCEALESVVLSDDITVIPADAFTCCFELKSVNIPKHVEEIGEKAFYGALFTKIEFPETLKSIGSYAFESCWMLEEVTIPASVTFIGEYAFNCCSSLKSAKILASAEKIPECMLRMCEELEELVISDSVISIGNEAFAHCAKLSKVTLGKNVETIGSLAFWDCDALTSIKLPEKLTEVPEYLFLNSYRLEEVVLPAGIKTIGKGAFMECKYLRKINLPEGLVKIDDDAFNFCKRMETIVIPSTVESIGNQAFMDCIALKSVYFKGEAPLMGAYPFHAYYGFVDAVELQVIPGLTLYYPNYSFSWWEPEWNGYPTKPWSGTFTDVVMGSYYEEAVLWAVDAGITKGTGELSFSPDLSCTRGQIVTFLWRAAGCPEPESMENPFTDIRAKDYYYKAVLWAVEQGITKGVGKGLFAPNDICTRAQAVTFLWRYEGKPDYSDWGVNFVDVPENSYYAQAVIWAFCFDITNGVGNGRFAPEEECTRGQIVTFLYRYLGW